MATLSIDIPDALVPDLAKALAQRMEVAEPTTPATRAELARTWIKADMKQVLLDYRAQQAALKVRADTSDPAVNW